MMVAMFSKGSVRLLGVLFSSSYNADEERIF